ncbi:MAG: HD domain-containing protein [Candidatus Eremiobacteraeota bacterium]|nr:HD domain-containing protein [Candidatus Eremiobacteraeota bacterium]
MEKETLKTLKKEVMKLIPEFEWIKDKDLRNKTLEVWCDAMKQGGWTPEDLDNMPFTLLLDPCPASFLTHTRSVTTITYQSGQTLKKFYGDKIDINLDYLVAGAILHDVGKLLEYEKKDGKVVKSHSGKCLRHPFSGVGLGFKGGMPEEVLHMIAMHAKEGNLSKRMPGAILVHHADFMNFEPFKK